MPESYTLQFLADLISADLQRAEPSCQVVGMLPLHLAQPNQLSFLSNRKYLSQLGKTKAAAVLIDPQMSGEYTGPAIVVENPYLAVAKIAALFDHAPTFELGYRAETVVVGQDCQVDDAVHLADHVVIGNKVILSKGVVIEAGAVLGDGVVIGQNSHIKSNVTLCHGVKIGANSLIHPGTVIGSDGFGNANHQGHWVKVPQLGSVRIGDHVEIGANTTIDRGAFDDTKIGDGVRIDNLVQIAHNVEIGDHTAIAANTGIAGSAIIGRHCLLGGAVNINGHIRIADKVIITGVSSVSNDINTPGATYSSGIPAEPASKWRRMIARFRHIDDLAKRLKNLEKNMNEQ
mgnify:CR=1 FL=1